MLTAYAGLVLLITKLQAWNERSRERGREEGYEREYQQGYAQAILDECPEKYEIRVKPML